MNKTDFSILIIEDEALVASDIRQILETSGYHVAGLADRMEKAVTIFAACRPSLLICDVKIKGATTGIEVVKRLRGIYTDFMVIYLTAYSDERTLEEALSTNPDSYLVKPFTDAQLKAAVSKALHTFAASHAVGDQCPFTMRQLDILALLKRGLTSNEIADLLCISVQTVKSHRKNMIRKTGTKNVTELISLSISNNWVAKDGDIKRAG